MASKRKHTTSIGNNQGGNAAGSTTLNYNDGGNPSRKRRRRTKLSSLPDEILVKISELALEPSLLHVSRKFYYLPPPAGRYVECQRALVGLAFAPRHPIITDIDDSTFSEALLPSHPTNSLDQLWNVPGLIDPGQWTLDDRQRLQSRLSRASWLRPSHLQWLQQHVLRSIVRLKLLTNQALPGWCRYVDVDLDEHEVFGEVLRSMRQFTPRNEPSMIESPDEGMPPGSEDEDEVQLQVENGELSEAEDSDEGSTSESDEDENENKKDDESSDEHPDEPSDEEEDEDGPNSEITLDDTRLGVNMESGTTIWAYFAVESIPSCLLTYPPIPAASYLLDVFLRIRGWCPQSFRQWDSQWTPGYIELRDNMSLDFDAEVLRESLWGAMHDRVNTDETCAARIGTNLIVNHCGFIGGHNYTSIDIFLLNAASVVFAKPKCFAVLVRKLLYHEADQYECTELNKPTSVSLAEARKLEQQLVGRLNGSPEGWDRDNRIACLEILREEIARLSRLDGEDKQWIGYHDAWDGNDSQKFGTDGVQRVFTCDVDCPSHPRRREIDEGTWRP